MRTKKGFKKRFISHVYMWILVVAGFVLVYIFIPSGILLFKKNIQVSSSAVIIGMLMFLFLVYYIPSAIWERRKFKLYSSSEMRRMIDLGVYGRCVHPTCTSLVVLGWIAFCIFPDLRLFFSIIWFTVVFVFWIRAEKSFFLGRRSKLELKNPEPV